MARIQDCPGALGQEYNTLDAQRDSAEAFIRSQRHEGWVALPDRYDDGGYTGANMDRPALKKLLDDVRAGLVDCGMVYKVDRLTRALLDFSRIVEVLDKHVTASSPSPSGLPTPMNPARWIRYIPRWQNGTLRPSVTTRR